MDLQTDCRDGPGSSHSPAVPYLDMSVCQNWDMRIANAPSHQLPPNAFSYPGIQLGKAELEVRWGCSCWGSKQAKARLGEGLKMAALKSNPRATLAQEEATCDAGGWYHPTLSTSTYCRCWGGGQGETEGLPSRWRGAANREGLDAVQLHLVSSSSVGFLSKRVFKSFRPNVSRSDKC